MPHQETRLLARGGGVAIATLNSVVCALCNYQYSERALRLLSFMRQRGLRPTAEAYAALVEACARQSNCAVAAELFHEALAAGHRVGSAARSELVRALCAAGQVCAPPRAALRLLPPRPARHCHPTPCTLSRDGASPFGRRAYFAVARSYGSARGVRSSSPALWRAGGFLPCSAHPRSGTARGKAQPPLLVQPPQLPRPLQPGSQRGCCRQCSQRSH